MFDRLRNDDDNLEPVEKLNEKDDNFEEFRDIHDKLKNVVSVDYNTMMTAVFGGIFSLASKSKMLGKILNLK